ncbi:MAG: DUF4357 domain-containing protein [Actinobacteria bacterium]|jgi:hypothetical protein|nr:DUF4357 domain-containing protein [Actinomycetota bacterium]
MSPGYAEMRAALRADGILIDGGDGSARFARDHAFRSPSAAATMVAGSNRNGPKVWRDDQVSPWRPFARKSRRCRGPVEAVPKVPAREWARRFTAG